MYLSCYYLHVCVCEGPEGVVQNPKVGEGGEEAGQGVAGETGVGYVQLLNKGKLLPLQAFDAVVIKPQTTHHLDGPDPGEDGEDVDQELRMTSNRPGDIQLSAKKN